MDDPRRADGRRERILILSAGVGSGHNSAAAALREACADRSDVEAVEVLDVLEVGSALYRDLLGKGYFVLVDGAPWIVSLGYDLSDQPFKRRGPVDPWTRANAMPSLRRLRAFRPTAVICTHFLPAQLIASLLLRGALDARCAIVTTDFDFQGLWLASAFHRLFLAREESRVQLAEWGVPVDRLGVTGIPVRPQPADAPPADAGAASMLLVSAGAAGGDYALAAVHQIMRMRSPLRAVIVCGRNEDLRREVETLTAGDDRFTVLGFTDRIPQLLREAALFIGKPGGLSASECMAAGLPMVLVNPIPGQEVRNGDYLIEEGAAVRCATTATLGWKVDRILSEPGRLARMRERAAAIGRPQAAPDVLEELLTGPAAPLVITRGAQKGLLEVSEQHRTAADLRGDEALVRLVRTDSDETLALVRGDELSELRAWLGGGGGGGDGDGDGDIALDRRGVDRIGQHWGARRIAERLLGDEASLVLRIR